MKNLSLLLSVLMLSSSFANASLVKEDYTPLKKLLGKQSLRCTPSIAPEAIKDGNPKPSKDLQGEGDDGYFTVSMLNSNIPQISENGKGMGYGFSTGEVRDMAATGSKVFLSVGDDGWQTLGIDFDDIGNTSNLPANCADAALIDYSSGIFLGYSIRLTCCLK